MTEASFGLQSSAKKNKKPLKSNQGYPPIAREKDKTRYCVTVYKKERTELYAFWRDFKNLATFMKDVESITVASPKISHWKIRLENGLTAEWTAEIIHEVPGEQISWKSTPDSEVQTQGTVWFADATHDASSVVGLNMDYQVPGGKLAEVFAALNAEDPKMLTKINLKRFKALMESGEVPTIEGQSDGREGERK